MVLKRLKSHDQIARKVRHLFLNEWKRVVSPRHMMKIYLHNNVVVAITGRQTALLWTWEEGARDIDLAAGDLAAPPEEHEAHACLPGAMFHPTRPGVLFFVWIYSPTDKKGNTRAESFALVSILIIPP